MSYRTSAFCLFAAANLIGTMALAASALAADFDPGYADIPPIPPQQVTFGSGWYVRGDIAAVDDDYKVDAVRTQTTNGVAFGIARAKALSYDLALGGGYAFTNSLRADITADFMQPTQSFEGNQSCIALGTRTCTIEGQFNRYDALFNGYYDIGTWSIVTPYIGAGVGVGFGSVKTTELYDSGAYGGSQNYHSFAWALMAGLAFDVYNHVKVDIGYRYLNNGTAFGTKLYDHQIRAGLRYMIDN